MNSGHFTVHWDQIRKSITNLFHPGICCVGHWSWIVAKGFVCKILPLLCFWRLGRVDCSGRCISGAMWWNHSRLQLLPTIHCQLCKWPMSHAILCNKKWIKQLSRPCTNLSLFLYVCILVCVFFDFCLLVIQVLKKILDYTSKHQLHPIKWLFFYHWLVCPWISVEKIILILTNFLVSFFSSDFSGKILKSKMYAEVTWPPPYTNKFRKVFFT
jgi:hypothetical protein